MSFSMIIASIVVASAVIMSLHAGTHYAAVGAHGGPHIEEILVRGIMWFADAGTLGVKRTALALQSGTL